MEEKKRENDKKLSEASKKYIAMNERLTARLKIADANKAGIPHAYMHTCMHAYIHTYIRTSA